MMVNAIFWALVIVFALCFSSYFCCFKQLMEKLKENKENRARAAAVSNDPEIRRDATTTNQLRIAGLLSREGLTGALQIIAESNNKFCYYCRHCRINRLEYVIELLKEPPFEIIANESIELSECIGSGSFGKVHKGLLNLRHQQQEEEEEAVFIDVAVKKLKSRDAENRKNIEEFVKEAKTTCALSSHPNITELIGVLLG